MKSYEWFGGKDEEYVGEYWVYVMVERVRERVYSGVMRFLIRGKGYEMNVREEGVLYFRRGIDIVDIGIEKRFEDDWGVIGRRGGVVIEFMK